MSGTVYLLHFSAPLAHAGHYLGWAKDVDARLARHRAGQGSRLVAVAVASGRTVEVARTWTGDRHLERRLKGQHHGPRLCPVCQANAD